MKVSTLYLVIFFGNVISFVLNLRAGFLDDAGHMTIAVMNLIFAVCMAYMCVEELKGKPKMIEQTLYILMRTDIPDMNPGKAVAHGSHATNDFEQWVRLIESQPDQYGELLAEIDAWREDRSFGRAIVLEATLDEIREVVTQNDFADTTYDPTYPWRNHYGDLFLSGEITCAWCFICNETEASESLRKLKLHR